MEEIIKINKLEIENVKRVKAVKVEPTKAGLTIVGGKNNQGKTSVLDAIAWALGGSKFKPSEPHRDGSVTDPYLKVVLSNGLVVERKGKNSDLKITDPQNSKNGQKLLDEFVEELALDLPKFMESSNKEKADILLKIIGVGDQLNKLELSEKETYNERLIIGRTADQKEKFAKEQIYYPDAPKEPVSAKELIEQQQQILAKNGENARKHEKVNQYEWEVSKHTEKVTELKRQLMEAEAQMNESKSNLAIAKKDTIELYDESTEELEKNIADIDSINIKVRANLDKEKAEDDARDYRDQYDQLTIKLNEVRDEKMKLLESAEMPIAGLSVEDGQLTYERFKWDNVSGSQQLKVATAIIRKLNPKCGFVLMDKLEQMDTETLNEFGQWLEKEGLQAIATRVSTGSECSIIIEDGYVLGQEMEDVQPKGKWKVGEF